MQSIIATDQRTMIIGLGKTGMSAARYLSARGKRFVVADSRGEPPNIAAFQTEFPEVETYLGPLNFEQWPQVKEIVLSPGVPRSEPAVAQAIAAGVSVVGDVELFIREAKAPLAAITGSNGKTTVTTLLAKMAEDAGVNVRVGGNLGTPALDLLSQEAELYVLELSSFQLESVSRLDADVATVLNITPDHMDRYDNIQAYMRAKQKIYWGARSIVVNRDDVLTQPPLNDEANWLYFGGNEPDLKDYGLRREPGGVFLARGLRNLLPVAELKIHGSHNWLNALAALAMGAALGLDETAMLVTLRSFRGMPHRCQYVAQIDQVAYYNDSKATNSGATKAAITGLSEVAEKIVLIAGGDSKGADFSELEDVFGDHLRALITLGEDGDKVANVCPDAVLHKRCSTLAQAVNMAKQLALPGDSVLLSPACASFDMFRDYEDRGEQFVALVEGLCPSH